MGKQCCCYKGNAQFTSPNFPSLCSFVLAVNVDGGQVSSGSKVGKIGRSRVHNYAAGGISWELGLNFEFC